MLHIQHHILCNFSYVVIVESMGKSIKYTIHFKVNVRLQGAYGGVCAYHAMHVGAKIV